MRHEGASIAIICQPALGILRLCLQPDYSPNFLGLRHDAPLNYPLTSHTWWICPFWSLGHLNQGLGNGRPDTHRLVVSWRSHCAGYRGSRFSPGAAPQTDRALTLNVPFTNSARVATNKGQQAGNGSPQKKHHTPRDSAPSARPGCPGGMKYKDRWLGGDFPDGKVLEPAAYLRFKRRMVLLSLKSRGASPPKRFRRDRPSLK